MGQKILLAEDEVGIAEVVSDYLIRDQYQVVLASDGLEALQKFDQTIDLVLLDINLPKLSGWEVCQEMRRVSKVPIIVLTARQPSQDELRGFELGADDYIRKPFDPKVLIARIARFLTRNQDQRIIESGDIRLDTGSFSLYKGQEKLELTAIQIDILEVLIGNQGSVISRQSLIDQAYRGDQFADIFDRTIDAHIKNIRKVLGDDSKHPRYIETIRGKGYRWVKPDD